MDRRTFLKGTVVGAGAIAAGIGKEALGAEESVPALESAGLGSH